MKVRSKKVFKLEINPSKNGQKQWLYFLLTVLFLTSLALAIFFDGPRSFLNISNTDQPVSSISTFFNPIEDEMREFLAVRMTRSVLLLFFSFAFFFKGLKFLSLKEKLQKYLVLSAFFGLFLVNIVIYFAWLTTEWTYILVFSTQIFVLIFLDYSLWLWIGRKNDKINYDYKKFFIFRHVSLAASLIIFGILFGLFASMVFSNEEADIIATVSYGNPVADWLYTFIAEVGKISNSFILIAILVFVLVLSLLYFSPQIYFYRQSFSRLKKIVPSFSLLIFASFALFIYSIYINIFANTNFVQFLPFGKNLTTNYLPMIIGISIHLVLLATYFLLNFTKLEKKIKDYKLSFFAFFLLISFISSFVSSYLSYVVFATIWINLSQIVFFIITYSLLIRTRKDFPLWLKLIFSFFTSLYILFTFIYLLNIHIYTNAVVALEAEKSPLVSTFYIDYSFYFYGILSVLVGIFVFVNLLVSIGKNTLILKTKKSQLDYKVLEKQVNTKNSQSENLKTLKSKS